MIYKSKNNLKITSFKIIELKNFTFMFITIGNKLFLTKSKTTIFDFF